MLTLTHAAGPRVKFPYWGILNYAEILCIKISPIFYIINPNPNSTGPSTPQYGNYSLKCYIYLLSTVYQ